jgi:hypothetical protein
MQRLLGLLAAFPLFVSTASAQVRTWDGGGGDGLWRTATNWSEDDIPDTIDEGAVIDGSGGQDTTATLRLGMSGVTEAMTNNTVTVDAGDQLTYRAGGNNFSGTFTVGSLTNAGIVDMNGGVSGNAGTATLNVTGANGFSNAGSGTVRVVNSSGSNRRQVILSIQAQSSNDGLLHANLTLNPDRNSAQLRLSGNGTFVNNGSIIVQYSTNSLASGSTQLSVSGNVMLTGTGTVTLASVAMDRAQFFSRSGTWVLTNGVAHTISGRGILGAGDTDPGSSTNPFLTATLNIVNQGCIAATGDTVALRVIPASTVENVASGRVVASGAAGLFLGSDSAAKTLTSDGVLQASEGSTMRFGTNTTLVLRGDTRGGGTYVGSPTVTLAGTTLMPGDSENADGTGASTVGALTVDGNLAMSSSTVLRVQLGNDGVAGTDYDTVSVSGNLTLDGTLAVEALVGYGAGSYRLFTCAPGGLTDNGLTSVAGAVVVTDVGAGTVDLVVANAATLVLIR